MSRPSDVEGELCFAPYDDLYHLDDDCDHDCPDDDDDDCLADVVTFWPRGPFEVDGVTYDPTTSLETGGNRAMIELIVDCEHGEVDA